MRLPKRCFVKYRENHPEEDDISDIEIELRLHIDAHKIVSLYYQIFDDYLNNAKFGDTLESKRQELKNGAISKLESRSAFFTDQGKALETLCGTDHEVTAFLNREQNFVLELFKEFVEGNVALSMKLFVEESANYSSTQSLIRLHKEVNRMLLDAKSCIVSESDFSVQINRISVVQFENLLAFYGREIERTVTERQIKGEVSTGNHSNVKLKPFGKQRMKESQFETTFESLFLPDFKAYTKESIELLREVSPELINTDNGWIGDKNAARIYVNA